MNEVIRWPISSSDRTFSSGLHGFRLPGGIQFVTEIISYPLFQRCAFRSARLNQIFTFLFFLDGIKVSPYSYIVAII
jgi:hypothetical protein